MGATPTLGRPEARKEGQLEPIEWPEWWHWDLEVSSHGLKRMGDRGFTETDLRGMLESATGCRRDVVEGRWVIPTQHDRRPWEIVVEPDEDRKLLVFVTAYRVEK